MDHDPYRCPDCDAERDSPSAACDACGYNPSPLTDAEPPEVAAAGAEPSLCFGCAPDTCTYPDCNMGRKRLPPDPRTSP